MQETTNALTKITIRLHWLIATLMIGLLGTGYYMETNGVYALYDWHKSFGVVVFIFAIWRIVWRIKKGWPSALSESNKFELIAAKVVHWLLITSTVLYPISGFMMSGAGGYGIPFFGMYLLPKLAKDDPLKSSELLGSISELGSALHGLMFWALVAIIVLHVVGALKHHFIYKDGTIKRMLGR